MSATLEGQIKLLKTKKFMALTTFTKVLRQIEAWWGQRARQLAFKMLNFPYTVLFRSTLSSLPTEQLFLFFLVLYFYNKSTASPIQGAIPIFSYFVHICHNNTFLTTGSPESVGLSFGDYEPIAHSKSLGKNCY